MANPRAVPEEEEFDDEVDMDMDEEEDEDGFDPLMAVLTTEDGETIADALSAIKDATEKIADALVMQNKILIKVLSAISAKTAPEVSS